MGPKKGAIVDRKEFAGRLDKYYEERGWDVKTSRPNDEKLEELGLDYLI
jgi:aldehyde:ferredoxin oxidoreductase